MSEHDAPPGGLVQELADRLSKQPAHHRPLPASGDRSGGSAVDDVLASMQGLADRPVHEHVAVFEQAHERLRRALDPRHG
ncbi:hypothetical protein [Nocardioides piscis]|uniref:Uncharacterized protein n=1 Tax=Nocardioides piscis TaxID=2714938 RepID=A0A6G7YHQ5_9ACTN|nr:hypothetical protein [Nocardioides piscis]QIK76424.1 hypothetical protein G7071_14345 [Nocardioides piscis]